MTMTLNEVIENFKKRVKDNPELQKRNTELNAKSDVDIATKKEALDKFREMIAKAQAKARENAETNNTETR